jgi:Ni,Fe-hydrogenase maturation factor
VRALTPQTQTGALVHHVRPESLLGLAQTLYGCAPPAHLVTVSVSSLALGGGLSPDVQAALPQAVAHITALAAAT